MNAHTSNIQLTGIRHEKQIIREHIAKESYSLSKQISSRNLPIHLLETMNVGQIDRKVKNGGSITFEEAFVGMCYVIAATNKHFLNTYQHSLGKAYGIKRFSHDRAIAVGTAFLNLMAVKESFFGLTADEISGMVSAGLMDTVMSLKHERILETCGMGGDKGFGEEGSRIKSINVSTLSAIVLASLGCVVAKHGSYANTTVVGSTDSLELFGANTNPLSENSLIQIWNSTNFCYLDAHLSKTLHDLSHLIMMETVNHVVGPMTPPFDSQTQVVKIMGVNEKVSPRSVALAYANLHQRSIQSNKGVFIIAGLNSHIDSSASEVSDEYLRKNVILDELSPFASFVSISIKDRYVGDEIVTPEDFGISINPKMITVQGNREAIHIANQEAIYGNNHHLVDYLSMNAALGLYAWKHLDWHEQTGSSHLNREILRKCFAECKQAIVSGKARATLEEFTRQSNE